MKALIVDDEPLARRLLRTLLAADPEVEVAGECAGVDAVAEIRRTRPELLFLDVQMPEVDGFEVLDRLGPDAPPAVVFVTAYDRYAVRAFEVHALDYLLKPVDDGRFAEALARAKDRARSAVPAPLPRFPARRLLVPTRDRTVVIEVDAIDWIEAADYCASIHVGPRAYLVREALADLERRLDPERFFRVHRSAIVALDRVREIHPLFRGDCVLVLSDGTRVRLARTRRAEFERRMTR